MIAHDQNILILGLVTHTIQKLAEAIFHYIAYPNGLQVLDVVEALVEKYLCLKECWSFNHLNACQQMIKYKMGKYCRS